MKTEWDYSTLAVSYVKRADYSHQAIETMLDKMGIRHGDLACDVGAGTANLTILLASKGLAVTAVEPNDAMREIGMNRTEGIVTVRWCAGTGEKTGQPDSTFDMVTFGSSFNVTDRQSSLKETHRILKSSGWFACMWNHRDLLDPIQMEIENIIKEHIPDYNYGARRQDQTDVIQKSGLFGKVVKIEGRVEHKQTMDDLVEAWRSHATLERQAGERFSSIVESIGGYVESLGCSTVTVPYTTRIWIAQAK